jgi:CubicO group peptidase (beta-lactamase class C family)
MNEMNIKDLEKKLKSVKIEGLIIQQGEKRVFEYFKNKKVQDKPSKVYSITKSILSILIGILVDKGLIRDIHTPIYHYFPELLETTDPLKKDITIFHLLTMTSGFQVRDFQGSKNWIRAILEQPVLYQPGSTFQYNSGDSHILSAIFHQETGTSTAAFAEDQLFEPIGIQRYGWVSDPQGIHGGGFSLSLSVEDMLRVGMLFLQKGKWKDKQIISEEWLSLAQMANKELETTEFGTYGYGYQLWTYESHHQQNPIHFYYANGIFGNFIFVVPSLQMVAVAKSQLQGEKQTLPMVFFEEFLRELEDAEQLTT